MIVMTGWTIAIAMAMIRSDGGWDGDGMVPLDPILCSERLLDP